MSSPQVLIVHNEATYYAGAERVLEYFLDGARERLTLAVAAPASSQVLTRSSTQVNTLPLEEDGRTFSPRHLLAQARMICRFRREFPFDLLHGWAARDWELTSLAGRLARVPTVGTLHDHPQAGFLSAARRRLMRWSAALGLDRVACVSDAVRAACQSAGFRADRLCVVHNGLPPSFFPPTPRFPPRGEPITFGFLGAFSERKGLRGLFEIIDRFASRTERPWKLLMAGGAQDAAGKTLTKEVWQSYADRSWWERVEWVGWTRDPIAFAASLDLLICPSSSFDPFPTVLLEAGAAGTPVLAADVGGVAEIVADGQTGWLFQPADADGAARRLVEIAAAPGSLRDCGERARRRVEAEFQVDRMVANYQGLYASLLA